MKTSRQRRIKICDVEAPPGSKSHGFIKAGELPAADVRVPIYIQTVMKGDMLGEIKTIFGEPLKL